LSFDRFHRQHKNSYRVNKITNERAGNPNRTAITPGKLAPALPVEIPDVVAATRFRPWFNEMMVSYDTVRIKLDDVVYADNSFLEVFDFPLLKGNRKQVLAEPYSAVLTESTAKKYFGKEDPVGKTMTTLMVSA
jgi:putative ABC transport system permease protein